MPFRELWESVTTWRRNQPEWIDGPFLQLEAEEVAEYIRQCWRDMYRLIRIFDSDLFHEPVKVGERLKKAVEEFKLYLPLMIQLRNPDLRPRHWVEVSKELSVRIQVNHSLTLRLLLANGSMDVLESISDISLTSTLEVKFERSLDQLEAAWDVSGKPNDSSLWEQEEQAYQKLVQQQQQQQQQQQKPLPPPPLPSICEALYVKFRFLPRTQSYVLDNAKELVRVLEDHIVTTIKLSASVYAVPFQQRVRALRAMQDLFLHFLLVSLNP